MTCFRISTTLVATFGFIATLHAQGVHPLNLFDTGLNMGYLLGHKKYHTASEQYTAWAGNASSKWIESWPSGLVDPIIPDISSPATAHEHYMNTIRAMKTCAERFFQSRLSLYRIGAYLGQALVETRNECPNCLQTELQRVSIELQTLGSLLKKPQLAELGKTLNASAATLQGSLAGDLARQQNEGLSSQVESAIQTLRMELPGAMMMCHTDAGWENAIQEQPDNAVESPAQSTSGGAVTVGLNSGAFTSDLGATGTKSGWYIQFIWMRGNPVFLMSGMKFFRNPTGEELMIPFQGQSFSSDDRYIQGFVLSLGAGGYLYQEEDIRLIGLAKFNYFLTHAIGGNLTTVGLLEVAEPVFHLEFGAAFAYRFLFFELSYEFGLSPALKLRNPLTNADEDLKYSMFNIGVGVGLW